MPLPSIFLQGKFFTITTNLEYSPQGGYFADKALVRRGEFNANLPPTTAESVELANELLANINNESKVNFVVIEFGFDKFRIITKDKFYAWEIDLSAEVSVDEANVNSLYNSFALFPAYSESQSDDAIINRYLHRVLKDCAIDQLEAQNIIVTGEMIWSGWLPAYTILETIADLVADDTDVFVDKWGVWQKMLFYDVPELLEISSKFFEPDISILINTKKFIEHSMGETFLRVKDAGASKQLILKQNRYPFFNLSDDATCNGKNLASMLFVDEVRPQIGELQEKNYELLKKTFEEFIWAGKEYEIAYECIVKHTQKAVHLDLPKRFSKKVGDQILQGEYLGIEQISERVKIDVNPDELVVTHGQLVASGELLSKKVKAPFDGKVNFDYLPNGYIEVVRSWESKLSSPVSGEVAKVDNKSVLINAEVLNFPVALVSGEDIEGYIIRPTQIKKFYGQKVILIVTDASTITAEWFIDEEVIIQGIIIPSCEYSELIEILKLTDKTVVILNELSSHNWGLKQKMLRKFIGRYAYLENHQLCVPLAPEKHFQRFALNIGKAVQISDLKLFNGDIVKTASYTSEYQYARIISVTEKNILAKTTRGIEEFNIRNITKIYNAE